MNEEYEPTDSFRLLLSYSKDVWRGFFQFGPIVDNKHITLMGGSLTELADSLFLRGLIDHLRECGSVGDFYIVVHPDDMKFAQNQEEDES